MGFGLRLYCFLLSVLVLLCAICARNTISLPGPGEREMNDFSKGYEIPGSEPCDTKSHEHRLVLRASCGDWNHLSLSLSLSLTLFITRLQDGVIMVDVGGGRDRDGRRCLKVETDDYGDPSANHGHDPKTKIVGAGGGRRGRDTP